MTLERDLERYLQTQVKRRGGIALKLAPTVKGVPDRLILAPGGGMWLVELKTETGRLSPAQGLWHQRAAAIGVRVATLWGKEQIREWLDAYLPNTKEN